MSLVVEQLYPNGVPQTAVAGFTPTGVGWHWTAGGTGRTGWNATVAHLIATRYTKNASYHGGFWVEHTADHANCRTVVQWIVPTTKAAHSVNPAACWQFNSAKDYRLQESRFAAVRTALPVKASDPNAGMIALAYAGMPANLQADLGCRIFRADMHNLARQLVAHPATVDRPHFGHGWIQPLTRYEMDVAYDFIGMLYGILPPPPPVPQEVDVLFWKPVQQDWMTGEGTRFFDGAGEEKFFVGTPERVRSIAEDSTGRWRLVRYGTELLVVDARGPNKVGPGLIPVNGTRIPASGYDFAPAEVVEKVVEVPDPEAEAKGIETEKSRIRALLGL